MFLSKIIRDSGGNKFSMTHTLVIARKSKIFVAIQNTCVAMDYFVTAFLVMTVNFYIHPFSSPCICGFSVE